MGPIIYNAHPVTKEYFGSGFADPDPMLRDSVTGAALEDVLSDADGWLLPAFAYLDQPPAPGAKEAVRRMADGSAWELVEDHRGAVFSTADRTEVILDDLGALPDGYTDLEPTSVYDVWDNGAWVANTAAQLAAKKQAARLVRDQAIADSQWLVDRHRDQVEVNMATTLTADQFSALLVYRQALRDWPSVADFPADSTMPAAPGWLSAAEESTAATA